MKHGATLLFKKIYSSILGISFDTGRQRELSEEKKQTGEEIG
jgi:hypothetical protein